MKKSVVFMSMAAVIVAIAIIVIRYVITKKKVAEQLEQLSRSMVAIPEKDYMLCKYEVSQALWMLVMGENPSCSIGEQLPVESVSWEDCQNFLKTLNAISKVSISGRIYRLPTADEWEYACRAGMIDKVGKFETGRGVLEDIHEDVASFEVKIESGPHPVGYKEPNALGLYDMHDNVCEWCQDEFRNPSPSPKENSNCRTYCGGSWSSPARFCTSSFRRCGAQDLHERYLGVRLACDVAK